MSYPIRIYYTDDQKKMMWERWQKGESMNAIGLLRVRFRFNKGTTQV